MVKLSQPPSSRESNESELLLTCTWKFLFDLTLSQGVCYKAGLSAGDQRMILGGGALHLWNTRVILNWEGWKMAGTLAFGSSEETT